MKTGLYIFFLCCTLSLLVSCSEDTLGETGIGNITGVVVFEGDNAPQANVKISTNPPSNTVFTGEDGSFDLGEVVVGDYSVQAEKSDFITAFEPATVTEGTTTNVIFELQPETANNVAPSIPILVTPADEAEDVAQDVLFTWTVTDPDPFDELVYQLELRNDMTNEILNFQNLSDTFLSVNDLAFSTKYFWQVTVNDGINPDVNSEFSSFNTIDEPNNRLVFVRKESNGNNVIYSTDDGSETGLGPLALTSQSSNSFRPRRNTEVNK
ncbi:carboxypeptidase-like regulatory domain-containing protein, partial [Dokdonia donghaensis]